MADQTPPNKPGADLNAGGCAQIIAACSLLLFCGGILAATFAGVDLTGLADLIDAATVIILAALAVAAFVYGTWRYR